jgi:exonuclease SbcC
MLLSRVQAINFRQYQKLDLEFKDGITGIVGPNGAGKSTILEAVLWCLFGNRAARTSKEGIKRQSAPESESCTVQLDFVLGGTTYSLSRSLVGKSSRSEAKLTQEGVFDAVSTREVDDYIVRLIGLDLKGFLSSFFARQRELNALSDARPADRKDHLARMLGVGRLDNAILLLKEEIKTTRQRIEILSGLQIDPEAVTQELNAKKADIARLDEEQASRRRLVDEYQQKAVSQEQKTAALRAKEAEYNRLEAERSALGERIEFTRKEIARLAGEIETLTKLANSLEPLKAKSSQIETLETEVASFRQAKILVEEKKRLDRERADLAAKLKRDGERQLSLEKDIDCLREAVAGKDGLSDEIAEGEALLEKLREEYRRLSGEIEVTKDKLKTLQDQKKEISELGPQASCKLCLRPFEGELEDIERHFDEEIRSLQHRLEPMTKRLKIVDGEGKTLREKLEAQRKIRQQVDINEQKLASAQAALDGAKESLADGRKREDEILSRLKEVGEVVFDPEATAKAEAELAEKRKARDEYIRLAERVARRPQVEKELAGVGERLRQAEAGLEENQKKIDALDFDREAYQQALDELQGIRNQISEIRLELEKVDGQIRLIKSEADALTAKLAEFEKSRIEISRLRGELEYLEKLSILFTEFRVYLIGRIRPALSRQTSRLFYEMTAGRYQEIELDDDYSLQIYDRGERFPITRFSGGEIDLANLCFRLAISVQMAETAGIEQSFIILDEIFGSQDTDRQRMIFEGLARLKNRFRQIIIISHIDDVKEMAENLITVGVDSAGVSQAVMVGG